MKMKETVHKKIVKRIKQVHKKHEKKGFISKRQKKKMLRALDEWKEINEG
jgi:hypothetical protein